MNKQGKFIDGKVVGGIEWVKWINPDGAERQGYTANPVGGCAHECEWLVEGQWAECYAKTVAERLAQRAYPHGFKHHYWHPEVLNEPLSVKTPSRIFFDSMSDLFGAWVPSEQIELVLDACRRASWHTFLTLTKNPPRLLKFKFPPNVHVGISAPPTRMFGETLTPEQQIRWLERGLAALGEVDVPVRWISIEPLSFNIAPLLKTANLQWAVVGAASNGPKYFPPNVEHFRRVVEVLDGRGIPLFFKGNMACLPEAVADWREEYPKAEVTA